jgi:hypothetical protein
MTRKGQGDFVGTLIEPQGVNAGAAIDAGTNWVPRTTPPDTHQLPPPQLSRIRPDEMVGLPEQKPGYPGLQRSIDTS